MRARLIENLTNFKPYNEQEEKDKALILHLLKTESDIFKRSHKEAHISASAWVINQDKTKVLMAYHNIYDTWSWLGGHADGDEDLLQVALKEVEEESGLTQIKAVSEDVFSVEVLTVDGHVKNNEYISSHLHLNITYLIEADDKEELEIKVDENSDIGWFTLEKAVLASNEKWFRDHIYRKLNQKLEIMNKGL